MPMPRTLALLHLWGYAWTIPLQSQTGRLWQSRERRSGQSMCITRKFPFTVRHTQEGSSRFSDPVHRQHPAFPVLLKGRASNVNAVYFPFNCRLKCDGQGLIVQGTRLTVKDVKEMFAIVSKRCAPHHQIVPVAKEVRMDPSRCSSILLAH
jgi:hypothetical protein